MGALESLHTQMAEVVLFLQAAATRRPTLQGGYSPLAEALTACLKWQRDATVDDVRMVEHIDALLMADRALADAIALGWDGWAGERLYLPRSEHDRAYWQQYRAYFNGEPVESWWLEERDRRRADLFAFATSLDEMKARAKEKEAANDA
jgi:hypothetical protein